MQDFLKKYINIFLIYIVIKQKYAIFPTLRLIFSILKRVYLLLFKSNLNNNLRSFYIRNFRYKYSLLKIDYLQFVKLHLLEEFLQYKNLLDYKYYVTFIEYSLDIFKKIKKILIKFIYIKINKFFYKIYKNRFYIYICYVLIFIIIYLKSFYIF